MTFAVQRNPVLIAVAYGIQLLPSIACHIYVVIHLEVYHLSLYQHITHIIQLFGTRDNVWVILCSVALLISIGHIMGYGLHTPQQILHLIRAVRNRRIHSFCLSQNGLCIGIQVVSLDGFPDIVFQLDNLRIQRLIVLYACLDTVNGLAGFHQ